MNKLQLYITKSGNVLKNVFSLNPNEDIRRHVRDLTRAVALIDYDPAEKNIFYMLTSVDEGVFFVILRTIPPQKNHHLAAWIFIPNGMRISGDRLYELVTLTTRKVSNPEVTNDDVADLREAFSTDYPTDGDAPFLTGAQGHEYAWRSYGERCGVSLADYAAMGLWQQSYIPYEGILLIDEDINVGVAAKSLDDVPLGEAAVLEVPEKTENNFTAYVWGRRLEHPMHATLGASVEISWRRPGFENVTVNEVINSRRFTPEPATTTGSHKVISTASFYITSQVTRDQLHGCTIRVNGKDITDEGRAFTSEELRGAAVLVSHEGFFPFSGQLDLASTTRALIQLQERRKIYRFELPLVSSEYGAPVKFELRTKKPITESPVEGYIACDEIQEGSTRTNHLGYSGTGTSLTSRIVYAVAGFILGAALMLGVNTCTGRHDNGSTLAPAANPDSIVPPKTPVAVAPPTPPAAPEPKENESAEETKAEAAVQTDNSLSVADAVSYMDNNTTWTRAELEKNPATRGLFDDLNNFRTDRIINHWGSVLKDSKRMQKVVTHTRQGVQKKKANLSGTYNKPGDDVISVQSYLNHVDP